MSVKMDARLARIRLKLHKASPTILFGLGAVAVVGGVVLCCRATLKVDDILDDYEERESKIEKSKEDADPEVYGENAYMHDKVVSKGMLAGDILLTYAPGIVCLGGGLALLFASKSVLERRNAALLSAYGALMETFQNYREHVRYVWGDQVDRQLMQAADGLTDIQVQNHEEDLTTAIVSIKPSDFGDGSYEGGSPYSRRFCPSTSTQAVSDMSRNLYSVKSMQEYANQILAINGYVFLNDVYDWLGFKRTPAGCVVGWLYHEDDPAEHIKFGIFKDDGNDAGLTPGSFYEEEPLALMLDFNVDGVIYDKI